MNSQLKQMVMIPYSKNDLSNHIFSNKINYRDSVWELTKNKLRINNIDFVTYDLSTSAIVGYFYYNSYYFKLMPVFKAIFNPKIILMYLQTEPEGVLKINSYKNLLILLDFFDVVFSYDQVFNNYKNFRRVNITFASNRLVESVNKVLLIVMMQSNKESDHPDELYSYRYDLIMKSFSRFPNDFKLYGDGWGSEFPDSVWVEDKVKELSKFRFSYIIENMRNISGYLSEKLFDSYQSLTVPIYLGARDILNYVPQNTLILMEDFNDINNLFDYLEYMSEETYQTYINNIKLFRNSNEYKQFSIHEFSSIISETIVNEPTKIKPFFKTVLILFYFFLVNTDLLISKILNKAKRILKGLI